MARVALEIVADDENHFVRDGVRYESFQDLGKVVCLSCVFMVEFCTRSSQSFAVPNCVGSAREDGRYVGFRKVENG